MTGYRNHPAVAAVLARFPGAEIVDVRHNDLSAPALAIDGAIEHVMVFKGKSCGMSTAAIRAVSVYVKDAIEKNPAGVIVPGALEKRASELPIETNSSGRETRDRSIGPASSLSPSDGAGSAGRAANGGEPSIGGKVAYVKRQGQTRDHHCHWPGCGAQVPPAVWGCKRHWFALPKFLRDKIWATFRPGQETNWTPSREYIAAAREVQDWIAANGGA